MSTDRPTMPDPCPFVRTLRPGNSGRDVGAYQRAFWRWNDKVRSYPESPGGPGGIGYFGDPMAAQAISFKRAWNENHPRDPMAPLLLIPDIGPNTHRALAGIHAFDALACKSLRESWAAAHPSESAADVVVACQRLALSKAGWMLYSGPGTTLIPLRWDGIEHHLLPPSCPHNADCSSLASWGLWVAAQTYPDVVMDPSQSGWGWGNTESMFPHGEKLAISDCLPGDLIFYGSWRPWLGRYETTHVQTVVEIVGGVPYTIGFGSQGGPDYLHYRYREDIAGARRYIRR